MNGKLTVAAVQMVCAPGAVAENLAHAGRLVGEAAAKGAQLVLLPELTPSGYLFTEEIWNYAETLDGPSVRWLLETARRYGIHLGFTFVEAEGEDFFNTFVLAGPEGRLLGRVRKSPPASIEANFFKAGTDPHVIDTAIGRVGVGICYENLLFDQMCFLHDAGVDIVLSPAAAGRPVPLLPGDVKRFENMLQGARAVFARTLGVPVVVANRAGPLEGRLPRPMPYLKTSFPGLSSIVDFDGTVLGELGDREGVIVAPVTFGSSVKRLAAPERYGTKWGVPVPWYAFLWPLTQWMGEKSYVRNPRRREKALAASRTGWV